jgi:hypothetical protein
MKHRIDSDALRYFARKKSTRAFVSLLDVASKMRVWNKYERLEEDEGGSPIG